MKVPCTQFLPQCDPHSRRERPAGNAGGGKECWWSIDQDALLSILVTVMSHDLIDKRSLELNRMVAEKIRRQPELMDFVRQNLDRTLREPILSESCKNALREWRTIFSLKSFDEILSILVEDSYEGQRLRQSTPFTGILNQRERLEVFRRYEPSGV